MHRRSAAPLVLRAARARTAITIAETSAAAGRVVGIGGGVRSSPPPCEAREGRRHFHLQHRTRGCEGREDPPAPVSDHGAARIATTTTTTTTKTLARRRGARSLTTVVTENNNNKAPSRPRPMLLHAEWVGEAPSAAATMKSSSSASASSATTTTTTTTTTAVFLHGLLGSGRNLKTLAQRYCSPTSSSSPPRRGLLLDLRGHGRSSSDANPSDDSDNSASVELCARDVDGTLRRLLVAAVTTKEETRNQNNRTVEDNHLHLVGHSLGGRVALQYCYDQRRSRTQSAATTTTTTTTPTPHVTRLWLLDTVPGAPNAGVVRVVNQVEQFLRDDRERLANMDGASTTQPTTNRRRHQDVARILASEYQIDAPTAQWLASSYREVPADTTTSGLPSSSSRSSSFAFSVPVAKALLSNFDNHDFWGQLEHVLDDDGDDDDHDDHHRQEGDDPEAAPPPPPLRVDLVVAGKNPMWRSTPDVMRRLDELQTKHPDRFRVHELPKAGHWVHVDDLEGLMEVMRRN